MQAMPDNLNKNYSFILKLGSLMKYLSFVIAFFVFALFSTNSFATIDASNTTDLAKIQQGQTANVFVHISAVKKTANGLTAQIDGFSAPKGEPGKGKLKARLEIRGNRLVIQLSPKGPKVAGLTMSDGYVLPKALAEKLGASNKVVMSGGSTMVKKEEKNMLWFEIQ